MASIFQSTINTRAILPNSFHFIRSDVPDKLTTTEIQWLIDHDVTTIVDLREAAEIAHRKCALEGHPAFEYLCMPVTGGNAVPESPEDVSQSYIRMVDTQMDRIIETIWKSETNVLYFCNAGKDRTGVVSALLLSKLGFGRENIIQDYMESKENLKEMLSAFSKRNPNVDVKVITPQYRYMDEFLNWLSK